jgi:hypothetical protein
MGLSHIGETWQIFRLDVWPTVKHHLICDRASDIGDADIGDADIGDVHIGDVYIGTNAYIDMDIGPKLLQVWRSTRRYVHPLAIAGVWPCRRNMAYVLQSLLIVKPHSMNTSLTLISIIIFASSWDSVIHCLFAGNRVFIALSMHVLIMHN